MYRFPWVRGFAVKLLKPEKSSGLQTCHAFEGHIACDAASRSEIVLPLIREGKLIGVLDIDSPVENRFDEDDERFLVDVAAIFHLLTRLTRSEFATLQRMR